MGTGLPSLLGLRAFEAAARHMSFKKAAEELLLTPSAISHRIARLESQLNVNLFHRFNRDLQLTDAGRAYIVSIQDAFQRVEDATQRLTRPSGGERLNIHSTPTFASLWLMPRLRRYIAANSHIDVRISASPTPANFVADEVHVDIRYGHPVWRGVTIHPLGIETISPLCSPRLLTGPHALRRPQDLARATLIHSEVGTVQWHDWIRLNGVEGVNVEHGLRFDRTLLTLQAAVDGLGVALDSERMAAADLAVGRLVRPFAKSTRNIEVSVHHLVFPPAHGRLANVRNFLTWILKELGDEKSFRRLDGDSAGGTRRTEGHGRSRANGPSRVEPRRKSS